MPVRLTILGSGSRGNCAHLEAGSTSLLVDAGFSARQVRARLASIGRQPESLSGILVTHEHTDHIQGLGVLCQKLGIPIYCNRGTQEAITAYFPGARFEFRLFATGDAFEIGEIGVHTFPVPHDAQDPVGFALEADRRRIGFLTDLGHATKLVLQRVRGSHALVLETNHDHRLLQDDMKRPWSVKQRISSRHGHLSNEAAAAVAKEVLAADLRQIYLGHLSRDCNRPDLALAAVGAVLAEAGAGHVGLVAADQDTPSPTLLV